MNSNMKRAFQAIKVISIILLVLTLSWWAYSYVMITGFSMALGKNSSFGISSSYGVIRTGKDKGFDEVPRIKFYSEDPSIYDRTVMSVRSVGIRMKTLRESPSFAYKSQSVEHRGRCMSWTTVSFPHWLLVVIFAAPWLWWSRAHILRFCRKTRICNHK